MLCSNCVFQVLPHSLGAAVVHFDSDNVDVWYSVTLLCLRNELGSTEHSANCSIDNSLMAKSVLFSLRPCKRMIVNVAGM